jgi:ABC-type xylose transport system permease subunit
MQRQGDPKQASALQRIMAIRDFGVLVAALVVAVFFSIATPVFLTPYNLFNLLRQTAQLGIIAMAMTMLIVSGEFDLSVGAIYAVVGVVTGLLTNKAGVNIWPSAAIGVAAGLLLGFPSLWTCSVVPSSSGWCRCRFCGCSSGAC